CGRVYRSELTMDEPRSLAGLDTSKAHVARVYDYWLGGKDNFKADREAAELMIQQYPDIVTGVRKNRAFLGRAVHYLAAEAGIRQFLDIGTGLPSSNNTHEVAQRAAPDARIVYVDNDPIVLSHAQALLTSTPEGACAYVDADIRDTGKILEDAANVLDFSRPVAICLIMILQFVPDEDDPVSIVRALVDAIPSGSYLTVAHPASDVDQHVGPALRQLSTRMGGTRAVPRSHQEVSRFFDGLEMVEPGLVQLHRWRPGTGLDDTGRLRRRRPQALAR
ncbi:MAG TPA: SAM-dependent methyltransferase, partial [Streptosporangiaceae bacterium]|nr:SAM-dependent methyltransferase [Streptosporangiaceae bacterium]